MNNVDLSVQQVVNRVDPVEAALPADLIMSLIGIVVPMLTDCFHRQSGATAESAHAEFVRTNSENPQRMLRRTAYQIRKQARREGQKITKDQSEVLARAVIAEACEPQNSQLFTDVVSEVSAQED